MPDPIEVVITNSSTIRDTIISVGIGAFIGIVGSLGVTWLGHRLSKQRDLERPTVEYLSEKSKETCKVIIDLVPAVSRLSTFNGSDPSEIERSETLDGLPEVWVGWVRDDDDVWVKRNLSSLHRKLLQKTSYLIRAVIECYSFPPSRIRKPVREAIEDDEARHLVFEDITRTILCLHTAWLHCDDKKKLKNNLKCYNRNVRYVQKIHADTVKGTLIAPLLGI